MPPRAVEHDEDRGEGPRLGGEEGEIPSTGEEEDSGGAIGRVAVEGVEEGMGAKAESAARESVAAQEGAGEKGEGGERVAAEGVGMVEDDDGSGGRDRLRGEVGAHAHAHWPSASVPAHLPSPSAFLHSARRHYLRIVTTAIIHINDREARPYFVTSSHGGPHIHLLSA